MGIRSLTRLLKPYQTKFCVCEQLKTIVVDGPGLIHALVPLFKKDILNGKHQSITNAIDVFIHAIRSVGVQHVKVWFDGGMEVLKKKTTRMRREELYRTMRTCQYRKEDYIIGGLRSPWLFYWVIHRLVYHKCQCQFAPKEADACCIQCALEMDGVVVGDDSDFYLGEAPYVNIGDWLTVQANGEIRAKEKPPVYAMKRCLEVLEVDLPVWKSIPYFLGDDYNEGILHYSVASLDKLIAIIKSKSKVYAPKVPQRPAHTMPCPYFWQCKLNDVMQHKCLYLPSVYDDLTVEKDAWFASMWIRRQLYVNMPGVDRVVEYVRKKCALKGVAVRAEHIPKHQHVLDQVCRQASFEKIGALFLKSCVKDCASRERAWAYWQTFFISLTWYMHYNHLKVPDEWWDWSRLENKHICDIQRMSLCDDGWTTVS